MLLDSPHRLLIHGLRIRQSTLQHICVFLSFHTLFHRLSSVFFSTSQLPSCRRELIFKLSHFELHFGNHCTAHSRSLNVQFLLGFVHLLLDLPLGLGPLFLLDLLSQLIVLIQQAVCDHEVSLGIVYAILDVGNFRLQDFQLIFLLDPLHLVFLNVTKHFLHFSCQFLLLCLLNRRQFFIVAFFRAIFFVLGFLVVVVEDAGVQRGLQCITLLFGVFLLLGEVRLLDS
mmetsp:Transcript_17034/g.28429  ORF Transcript_17034/g.28429 Transcript_17034/m.28429 type:complete len:228 (-) Transcript_17034:1534-2217(-)